MPEPVWYRLRQSRADPPDRASRDDRRRALYVAALQQFEEMIDAARAVGPATRPLQLYFALTQAGRAILAAHGDQPKAPPKHGLTLGLIATDLIETTVEPSGSGEFQAIASIVGSASLTAPVELGALWSSIPDLFATPLPDRRRWPRALPVVPYGEGTTIILLSHDARAVVVFDERVDADEVGAALAKYPTASDAELYTPDGKSPAIVPTGWGYGVVVTWHASGSNESDRLKRIAEAAPLHRFRDRYYLRPEVGQQSDRLTPLMAWWALMYGFSMLARYEPAAWTRVLDVNRSPLAVPTEDVLEEAIRAIPHLVLEALQGEPLILPE